MGPLRPPDLIIQDELHLISGPLGTLVGLYETAVDGLSTWDFDGHAVRPKVIASTATIRRSEEQIHNLFLRKVKIFPPAGLDVDDNFFSRRQPSSDDSPGRLYIGICAPGTRMKTVLIRVYVAYMAAAQTLYEKHGRLADPWMTLVGYFNSIRDLGGMRRAVGDTVSNRLRRISARGLATRAITAFDVEELTSRKSAVEIPKILDKLEQVFDPEQDRERQQRRKNRQAIDSAKQPLSVVLATNMISVGVDVGRLSLMVVANQPKATAEYIQATSRVGRSFPGLVCTVYNWARPRDLSHYERFEHYHDTFYQHVEALSVTPFSPRAMDRGLSGVLVSYIRLLGTDFNRNEKAGVLRRDHDYVTLALSAISRRAGLVTGDQDAEDLTEDMLKRRLDQWLSTIAQRTGGSLLGYEGRNDGRTINLLEKPGKDWDYFTCLNSLREVEPNVRLILLDQNMDNDPLPSESEAPAT